MAVELEALPFKALLYDALNNVFFLGAALVYVIQGIWMMDNTTDLTHCRGKEGDDSVNLCSRFVINFLGSMMYLTSALFSYLGSRESNKQRALQGWPPLRLLSSHVHLLDWFVWGDLVMILASLQPLVTVACAETGGFSDEFFTNLNLAGCVLFLADSLIYTAGYWFYMMEVRSELKNALRLERRRERDREKERERDGRVGDVVEEGKAVVVRNSDDVASRDSFPVANHKADVNDCSYSLVKGEEEVMGDDGQEVGIDEADRLKFSPST